LSDTERTDKPGKPVTHLDLSKLKNNKSEDVDININLAKTLNKSSDIF
jgi:hypothetical protein